MPETAMKSHGFTRRNFIKGAAVLSAAGVLAGCSANQGDMEITEEPEEESEAAPADEAPT